MSDKLEKPRRKVKRKKYVAPDFELAFEFNRKSLSCGGGPINADTIVAGCGLATSD